MSAEDLTRRRRPKPGGGSTFEVFKFFDGDDISTLFKHYIKILMMIIIIIKITIIITIILIMIIIIITIIVTSAPIGAREMKLKIMTDQRTT